jgi:hypothetical protein
MKTAVEWLRIRLIPTLCDEEDIKHNIKCWEQAKVIEEKQNEKYNELKEVIENIIEHLDEGRVLTLRKDSIIVEALRNSINKKIV